jgi:ATP-binding protein involved in chromosome partitioning
LPLKLDIRVQTDSGNPTVVAEPKGPVAALYHEIASHVATIVAGLPLDVSGTKPSVVARNA